MIVDIALQLLKRVETLHDLGYIHGDIQLKHVCLTPKDDSRLVYLIDFTTSQKVLHKTAKRKQVADLTINDFQDFDVPFDALVDLRGVF